MTITSGNGPGPARNDEERLDREWMRGQIATVPAHHCTVVSNASASKFYAVCRSCGRIGWGYDFGSADWIGSEHQREHAA